MEKGGGGWGQERPLCHIGRDSVMAMSLGRGKGAAGRAYAGSGTQQHATHSHERAVGVGAGAGLGQAAERWGTLCLARPAPHTGSGVAQGSWSEFTTQTTRAASKGSTGPQGLYEASGPVSRRGRLAVWFLRSRFCAAAEGVPEAALPGSADAENRTRPREGDRQAL